MNGKAGTTGITNHNSVGNMKAMARLVFGNSSRDVAGGVLGWQSMPCD
jgi:hypothetical protein